MQHFHWIKGIINSSGIIPLLKQKLKYDGIKLDIQNISEVFLSFTKLNSKWNEKNNFYIYNLHKFSYKFISRALELLIFQSQELKHFTSFSLCFYSHTKQICHLLQILEMQKFWILNNREGFVYNIETFCYSLVLLFFFNFFFIQNAEFNTFDYSVYSETMLWWLSVFFHI